MSQYQIPFWKEAPCIRVVVPFITGILVAHHLDVEETYLSAAMAAACCALIAFSFVRLKWRFRLQSINGFIVAVLIALFGTYVATYKNPFRWIDVIDPYCWGSTFIVSLDEPLQEKKSSWKAIAKIIEIRRKAERICPESNVIVYFRKDSTATLPTYGSCIMFKQSLSRITNFLAGSRFEYQRYCALKNIHYQVFLRPGDYVVCNGSSANRISAGIFEAQRSVVRTLKKYIPGTKESGLAEALLIGYKNDLDKDLIQSYSNTGVVHVVAISGLHLGLIYAMLGLLCRPLSNATRAGRVIKAFIILSGLWLFTFLAGASPSVLRSAVMFTFIVTGDTLSKKATLLNSLSASALLLLWWDPYWLFDLGFILSYTALLSIMLFQKLIFSLYVPHNKIIDTVWKMIAVTLAAQILTMPVLIYYFQQIPTLFVFTNLVAIPLSGIILTGEIVLCILSWCEPAAYVIGKILGKLIQCMNSTVQYADSFSFSTIKGLNISLLQLVVLYIFIAWVFIVVLHPFKATR